MSYVYQRLMSDGQWELNLRPDTPRSIVQSLYAFNTHMMVCPSQIDVGSSDAVFKAACRYWGPLRRLTNNRLTLSGPGLSMWLSDPDGKGDIIESATSAATPTLSNWINALLPTTFTAGTVTSPGGSWSNTYYLVSRRQAIDSVCRAFGVEWRINNDLTFDVGTKGTLYRSVADGDTPAAIVARNVGGRDPQVVGIRADINTDVDWTDFVDDIIIVNYGVGDAAGVPHFLKPHGSALDWQRVVVDPTCPDGAESGVALAIYNAMPTTAFGRRETKVSTDLFDVAGDVTLGDDVWVWDPENGIVDTANQVTYQGQLLPAVAMRCVGMRWPIRQGMGVYLRVTNTTPTAPTYYDITPWVEFEDGSADIELGPAAARSLTTDSAGALVQVQTQALAAPYQTMTPTLSGTGGSPAIGNGTITGAYRRDGTTLHYHGQVTFGSTTAVGTTSTTISLPSGTTAVSTTSQYQHGKGFGIDASSGDIFEIYYDVAPSGTVMTLRVNNFTYDPTLGSAQTAYNKLVPLKNTVPVTWTTSDIFTWSITLEVQP